MLPVKIIQQKNKSATISPKRIQPPKNWNVIDRENVVLFIQKAKEPDL